MIAPENIDLSGWDNSKTIRIPLLRRYFPKMLIENKK
jgi:hypothetical protein